MTASPLQPVVVRAPASKSLSHRALAASALASGVSRLTNVLESDDTRRTMDVLALCGAHFTRTGAGAYTVTGLAGKPQGAADAKTPVECFMGESGTSCRLLTAVLAAGEGAFYLHGGGRLHERPMRPLTDALEHLGASFTYMGETGFLPFVLHARRLRNEGCGSEYLPVVCDLSSQFFSGLLLAAPLMQGGLTLGPEGEKAVSWPYVGLTLQVMDDFGCRFGMETRAHRDAPWNACDWRRAGRAGQALPGHLRIRVAEGAYKSRAYAIEGDYSGASYLAAAGALGPRPVTVLGMRRDSLQGDAVILDILAAMGASVCWHDGGVTVAPGPLAGLTLDMGNCPDLVPTVAVLAAHAAGSTSISNIAHLTAKESDRLHALERELAKAGACVQATENGLHIEPGPLPKGETLRFSTHDDHRMAMALALFECGGMRVSLDNPACVTKSFPEFWDVWEGICPQTGRGA